MAKIEILTTDQAKAAVQEMLDSTGWSMNRLATFTCVNAATLSRLMDGKITLPTKGTFDRLAHGLKRVRGIK